MKKFLSSFSFLLIFGMSLNAQAPQNGQMDQSIDQSLNQIQSFLDTLNLDQLFGGQMMEMMPSPEEMNQIQEQMKVGLQALEGFDFTLFENFIKEMEKSMPHMKELMPDGPIEFGKQQPEKKDESGKPIKKI